LSALLQKKSPSQNVALLNYLLSNNIEFVQNGKLNPIFNFQPGALLKKYGIDIKQLIVMYPIEEKERKEKNAVR